MKHYHKNPRTITDVEFEQLQEWLLELGDLSGITHDLNSDEVITGNQRVDALDLMAAEPVIVERFDPPTEQGTVALGYYEVAGERYSYRATHWTPEQCEKANIVANKAGGSWDWEELKEWDQGDLAEWGFSEEELGEWFEDEDGDVADDPGAQVDRAAELLEKWGVERGQVWQAGRHRLMCGDSTSAEDVGRLMGGERAAFMWTDPPYGVDYTGGTTDALKIEGDTPGGLLELLVEAFAVVDEVLVGGAPVYVAHPAVALQFTFGTAFLGAGWHFHEGLVWMKDSMVLGHSDYHLQHEGLHYGWKEGGRHPWYGGRVQKSVFEIERPKRSEAHPTMKPVQLVVECLLNSSAAGDIGIDPFLGSGTTLVACEQTGRTGYGMEIEPRYCAVSLERLTGLGLEARLAE